MSVLMASSSMPSVAFAADLFSDGTAAEFTAEETAGETDVFAEEAEADDAVLQAAVHTEVEFKYGKEEGKDTTVELKYLDEKNNVLDVETYTATLKEISKCDQVPQVMLTVTINGETKTESFTKGTWVNGIFVEETKKVEHDWQDTGKVEYDHTVEHGETVTVYPVVKCSKCGKEKKDETKGTLSTVEHEWEDTVRYIAGDNVKADDKGYAVLDENGKPVLIDESIGGTYYKQIRCKAYETEKNKGVKWLDADGKEWDEAKPISVAAKKAAKAVVTLGDNIDSTKTVIKAEYQLQELPLKEKDIVLKNCKEKGYYTITYKSEKGVEVDTVTITVEPHHVEDVPSVTYDANKYKNIFNWKWDDKNNKAVVTNTSCNVAVPYVETVKCKSCGTTLSTTSKVAEPQGHHPISDAAQKKVAEYESAKKSATAYYDLAKVTKTQNYHINITNDTSTCDAAGTITVEYLCTVCGKVAQTQTVKVAAKNHDKKTDKIENRVEPTCTKDGSYDVVTYCDYCGKALVTKPVVLSKIKHTNQTDVNKDDNNDKTAAIEFTGKVVIDLPLYGENVFAGNAGKDVNVAEYLGWSYGDVKAQVYTLCETCGEYKNKNFTLDKVTVDKVTKEGKDCQPGSITLTATYTKTNKDVKGEKVVVTETFDYYSSVTAYQGRTAHDPAPAVKENVVEATATENGSYDEVVYCSVCGTEISRKTVTVTATGEVILPAVTGLKATATGTKRVALSWDAVEGAEGYFIIGFGENRTGSQIAYTTRTSWTDTAADSDAFNFYWVQPFNRNAAGKIVKGELGGYKYALGRVVAATSKVTATATEDGIELNWAAVSGANSYVVMSKTGSADAEFNASVATDTTTYVDTTASSGEVTYYWVYATYKNADGKALAAGKTSPFAWAIAK